MRIKHRLSPQKGTCQAKQPVCDTAEGASVRVAVFAERGVASATVGIVLSGDTCPVIDRVTQSDMRSVAHYDDV